MVVKLSFNAIFEGVFLNKNSIILQLKLRNKAYVFKLF